MTKQTPDKVTPLRRTIPCPQCTKPSLRETFPFCSKRCADIDLGAWLKGSYTIAGSDEDASGSNDK